MWMGILDGDQDSCWVVKTDDKRRYLCRPPQEQATAFNLATPRHVPVRGLTRVDDEMNDPVVPAVQFDNIAIQRNTTIQILTIIVPKLL